MYLFYGVGHSKLDVTSPKSTLLKAGSPPPTTWGSLERESSFDITGKLAPLEKLEKAKGPVKSSISQEFLVDHQDTSP